MPRKPDAWTRFLGRFVKTDLEAKEQATEDVIAHADLIRREADNLLRMEYARADARYRAKRV